MQLDEEQIIRYLLGALPESEMERFDEMSLADDDFAERLRSVENDLVDSYVQGELSGETLAKFQSHYLTSSRRRDKVAFAQTFLSTLDKPQFAPKEAIAFTKPRATFRNRALVAAAILIFCGSGFLLFQNLRLQDQIDRERSEYASLQQRKTELEKSLEQQRTSQAEAEKELAQVREKLTTLGLNGSQQSDGKLLAFRLSPQARSLNPLPVLEIPAGTNMIAFTLELEADDFSSYRAELKDPKDDQVLWISSIRKPREKPVVVKLPANLLKTQNYLFELSGISPNGAAEVVSSYPFRAIPQ